MADKITLDFEAGTIEWDTPTQKGCHDRSDLNDRREEILKAMGYKTIDMKPFFDQLNKAVNGEISWEELQWWTEGWCADEKQAKSEQSILGIFKVL